MMYGMSPKLPNINYNDSTGQEYGFQKPYSEETARLIDEEISRIISEQYERAKEILRKYSSEHNQLRDMLIKNEVIYTQDVENVLGKRQWKSRTDEILEINKKEDTSAPKALESSDEKKDGDDTAENAGSDSEDSETPPPFEKI
jgi:cell division protease FtsH